ncbi:MAG: DUF2065 domain-containing protein [Gemmobacter sp.]|jgi:uncharacterized protein|nr:DUF2065 domain-containing protein [Gemmobacter sp.]
MSMVLLALGLVLAAEGLAFALAPSRMQDIVALIASISPERRRVIGLVMLGLGVALVWAARRLGAG